MQTFLQARGAAVDPLGVAVDPAHSRSQDSGHREIHVHPDDTLQHVASRSNDSGDGDDIVSRGTRLNRIFGEVPEEKQAVVVEEQEDVKEESFEMENKDQSVEEQLRQALERCDSVS